MKKLFVSVLFLALVPFVMFTQEREAEITSLVPVMSYNIEYQFNISTPGNYYIKFYNTYDPPLIYNGEKQEFIQKQMIEKLHKIYENGSTVFIEGPVAYLYYENIVLTEEKIDEIRLDVESLDNKMVCVDISNCYFSPELKGLPAEAFSDLENLYWLYLGNMLGRKLPEKMCFNCTNLMAVYVWNESGICADTFTNVNPESFIISEDMYYITFGEYVLKNTIVPETSDIDEVTELTESENNIITEEPEKLPEVNNLKPVPTGVVWLVDEWGRMEPQQPVEMEDEFGLYDIINDENFVPEDDNEFAQIPDIENILYGNLENPDFRSIENASVLDKENLWFYDWSYPLTSDPVSVVKSFLASYISNNGLYQDWLGYSDTKLEINLDDNLPASIRNYKNLQLYIINSYDTESYEIPILVGIEGEINGETVKEMSLIKLKNIDNQWFVINIYNGWLNYYRGKITSNSSEL